MTTPWGVWPEVAVGGQTLSDEVVARLERVVVDHDALRPDMFELTLRDPERTVIAQAGARIGGELRITATAAGGGAEEELILGDITALEADLDASGNRVLIRGYDRSHRFTRGIRTETYRDVTDSDIARTLAQRAGIAVGNIEDTPVVHPLVSQVNSSDWDFLQSRAREVGYVAAVVSGKLDFHPPVDSGEAPEPGMLDSSDPLQLVLGADLETFRPRLSSSGQVASVEVRGWSPERKDAVVGTADATTRRARLADEPAALAGLFGEHRWLATDHAYAHQAEVDGAAAALADRVASSFAEAEGRARGNPRLRAGQAVSVALVGERFEGRYLLSATRHVFDEHGYRTHLAITGAQDRSLLGLASNGNGERRIPGVVTGIVTAVDDPDGRGRVKLRFPWLSESYETAWARVAQVSAGGDRGSAFPPEVGDEVLVAFEQGEIRSPYVLGGLYNGVDAPDLGGSLTEGGSVRRRGVKTVAGHQLVFIEGGSTAVELTASGDILIKASGDVAIEAGGTLDLTAQRGITIDAGAGDVTVSGRTIRLN